MAFQIQNQHQADEIFNRLANSYARLLKIPLDEAKRRAENLLNSGLLTGQDPEGDTTTQTLITSFMEIPSNESKKIKAWKVLKPLDSKLKRL